MPTLLVPFPEASPLPRPPPPLGASAPAELPPPRVPPPPLLLFTSSLPERFLWGGICSCCGLVPGRESTCWRQGALHRKEARVSTLHGTRIPCVHTLEWGHRQMRPLRSWPVGPPSGSLHRTPAGPPYSIAATPGSSLPRVLSEAPRGQAAVQEPSSQGSSGASPLLSI